MLNRRQYDLGGKRQGGHHGPWCERAVIGAKGRPARNIVEEDTRHAIDVPGEHAGPVAGGRAPAEFPILHESERIPHRILLLYKGSAATVLEIIALMLLHERVADTAKIDPDVRQLMDEQRTGV